MKQACSSLFCRFSQELFGNGFCIVQGLALHDVAQLEM